MYLTENWRLKAQRYILQGVRTPETHEVTFPPRPVTPRDVETYEFDDTAPEPEHPYDVIDRAEVPA
jgi:hypothetical protein